MTSRRLHAIRGATTVGRDDPDEIRAATRELLGKIAALNRLSGPEIVSVIFTVTPDLKSEFPARAARDLGWTDVALMCMSEIDVPGSLPLCIRVLVHVEFARPRRPGFHVYLRDAIALRPDLARSPHRAAATTSRIRLTPSTTRDSSGPNENRT